MQSWQSCWPDNVWLRVHRTKRSIGALCVSLNTIGATRIRSGCGMRSRRSALRGENADVASRVSRAWFKGGESSDPASEQMRRPSPLARQSSADRIAVSSLWTTPGATSDDLWITLSRQEIESVAYRGTVAALSFENQRLDKALSGL